VDLKILSGNIIETELINCVSGVQSVRRTVMADIPVMDLQAQHRALRPELDAAMARVLESNGFILGKEVAEFEREFASYCGVKHAIGVNSGTSALHLALLAAGVQAGDEVITTPFTFVATTSAILYCGARPVYIDIDPVTFNLDPGRIEAAITAKTRAILPVHLYGQMAEMDSILRLAKKHNLKVVEDAAQAHGAEYQGKRAGGWGDAGCFSFYPTKNLGACGEAGLVTTNDDAIAADVRSRRDWGATQKYHFDRVGFNYRMEGLQGAVLRVKLKHLEKWTQRRREIAQTYDRAWKNGPFRTPVELSNRRHVYHLYTLQSSRRDEVVTALAAQGIGTSIAYPVPLHRQKAFVALGYESGCFPVAEQAAREVWSMPLYPELGFEQVERITHALQRLG
jgi:dTDP-4-amino-4,6-dideoxygalactose transaminase